MHARRAGQGERVAFTALPVLCTAPPACLPHVHALCPLAQVTGSVVLDGVDIGAGAVVRDCLVGPGCKIGERASLKDCVLGAGREVSAGVELRGEVLV